MQLRTAPSVVELNQYYGAMVSPDFVGRNLSTVCIAIRYFLNENFSASLKLAALDATNNIVTESSDFMVGVNRSYYTLNAYAFFLHFVVLTRCESHFRISAVRNC